MLDGGPNTLLISSVLMCTPFWSLPLATEWEPG
uniref:Uncharacterized protein n=1 Tax=Anguilla anguilla TaxID=7936 RepID=A0A0E9SM89_ANGAN